jgi:hypothetical protein
VKFTSSLSLFFLIAIIIFGLYLLVLKRDNKKIKCIGEVEFTTSVLRKRIGDSLIEYNYQSIKGIEIQKHIRAALGKDFKNGYFSYILRIIFDDLSSESVIISGKSIDPRKKVTIIETMKTLKRMTKIEILLP